MAQFILPYSTETRPLSQVRANMTAIAAPNGSGDFTCPGGGGWDIIAMMPSTDTGAQVGAYNGTVVQQGGGQLFPVNGDRVGLADGEWSPVPHNTLNGGQTYTVQITLVDAAATAISVYLLLRKRGSFCE